jgi:hypothetical protein
VSERLEQQRRDSPLEEEIAGRGDEGERVV